MHTSGLHYGKLFFKNYVSSNILTNLIIVDIGSQDINGSLRQFAPHGCQYIGGDFVAGAGVDVVFEDPYTLPFETGSVDVIVCSSVYEHSEFFWLLFLESMRILKPTGLLYLNVPSNGKLHRHPVDAWRFYPDAAKSLTNWARRNGMQVILLESFIGNKMGAITSDGMWNDYVAIFARDEFCAPLNCKTVADDATLLCAIYKRGSTQPFSDDELMPDSILIDHLIEEGKKLEVINKQLFSEAQAKQAEADHMNHLVVAMQNSRSWRYTGVLRKLVSLARLPVNFYRKVKEKAGSSGAFSLSAIKALKILRLEGLQGVRVRLSDIKHTTRVITPSGQAVDRNDYQEWIKLYDTLDAEAVECIKAEIAGFKVLPKISVIMPVYNPPLDFLKQAIESVQAQLYPNWDLCIADDASTNKEIRLMLEAFANSDDRITVFFRAENGLISAASNTALALATGEFVALLDNVDLLSSHALFHVAKTIIAAPEAAVIYSDEDKIDAAGLRKDPYFKCQLNYELLLAHNMVSHLAVYRRTLLNQIGGFRLGFEGAQYYDLVLRVLEACNSKQVHHIPKVLYHWRAISGSAVLGAGEKNYASDVARRAISEHLHRSGRGGAVSPAPDAPLFSRVRYPLPKNLPFISIVIPTKDRADLLGTCLNSLLQKTTYQNFEVIVVDNGSKNQATQQLIDQLPKNKVIILRDNRPFNYSALNNAAVLQSKGEVICLMNNDIEILSADWIEEMLSFTMQTDVGCVGAKLLYPDGRLQHGGVITGIGGVAGHSHKYLPKDGNGYASRARLHQSLSAVTGALLMVRRTVWDEAKGLDEDFAVAFNDVDFCLRVKALGYRNVWTPYAEMNHYESASRGLETTPKKQARFLSEVRRIQDRWGESLKGDPAYSPNLTLDYEDFSLAWPPRY